MWCWGASIIAKRFGWCQHCFLWRRHWHVMFFHVRQGITTIFWFISSGCFSRFLLCSTLLRIGRRTTDWLRIFVGFNRLCHAQTKITWSDYHFQVVAAYKIGGSETRFWGLPFPMPTITITNWIYIPSQITTGSKKPFSSSKSCSDLFILVFLIIFAADRSCS